jgi:hypothetical protein
MNKAALYYSKIFHFLNKQYGERCLCKNWGHSRQEEGSVEIESFITFCDKIMEESKVSDKHKKICFICQSVLEAMVSCVEGKNVRYFSVNELKIPKIEGVESLGVCSIQIKLFNIIYKHLYPAKVSLSI